MLPMKVPDVRKRMRHGRFGLEKESLHIIPSAERRIRIIRFRNTPMPWWKHQDGKRAGS